MLTARAVLSRVTDFWTAYERGSTPLPWTPALCEDLYAGFRCWCLATGFQPVAIKDFVPAAMRVGQVRRVTVRVPDPDGAGARFVKQERHPRRVLLVGFQPLLEQAAETRAIVRGVREFRFALRAWQRQLKALPVALASSPKFVAGGADAHAG